MLIAIDPGRDKCGLAIVQPDGEVLELFLVRATELLEQVQICLAKYPQSQILLGDGTQSAGVQHSLASLNQTVILVDERNTTLQASELYWHKNKPSFWQSLLPIRWRSLPEPVDAYAAWAIALRFLQNTKYKIKTKK